MARVGRGGITGNVPGQDFTSPSPCTHVQVACGAPTGAVTHGALLRSTAYIVTMVTQGPHTLTGRAQPLPAATARAAGPLTKVGNGLDAACGAVGAAVPSEVRGEYTQSAPRYVRFHRSQW